MAAPVTSPAPADALQPSLFVNHGGGPLPLLADPAHASLISHLKTVCSAAPKPRAIIIASAHWETPEPVVASGAAPALIYDYSGFPPQAYSIKYRSPGAPELCRQVQQLLEANSIRCSADASRGWDHGVFVPLALMFPLADVPICQLSLPISRSPSLCYAMGRALLPLRSDNVLIIGSGSSFHNIRAMFSSDPSIHTRSLAFDAHISAALSSPHSSARAAALENWTTAPHARYCHPEEEHLMPLMFVAGAGHGCECECIYADSFFGAKVSGFRFK